LVEDIAAVVVVLLRYSAEVVVEIGLRCVTERRE
jgi:hypothetical protein